MEIKNGIRTLLRVWETGRINSEPELPREPQSNPGNFAIFSSSEISRAGEIDRVVWCNLTP